MTAFQVGTKYQHYFTMTSESILRDFLSMCYRKIRLTCVINIKQMCNDIVYFTSIWYDLMTSIWYHEWILVVTPIRCYHDGNEHLHHVNKIDVKYGFPNFKSSLNNLIALFSHAQKKYWNRYKNLFWNPLLAKKEVASIWSRTSRAINIEHEIEQEGQST